jgi:hypothetical protein
MLEAPKRDSFLEDFCHYFCGYGRVFGITSPSLAAFFMKIISASHWMAMLGDVELVLSEMRKVEQASTLDASFGHQQK